MYVNPFSRFVYWNMNYHVEHHMFPTVPYHALPALHEEMKADCPPPYRGSFDVYREMIPALIK
jgi:fatty acid desaturase